MSRTGSIPDWIHTFQIWNICHTGGVSIHQNIQVVNRPPWPINTGPFHQRSHQKKQQQQQQHVKKRNGNVPTLRAPLWV